MNAVSKAISAVHINLQQVKK